MIAFGAARRRFFPRRLGSAAGVLLLAGAIALAVGFPEPGLAEDLIAKYGDWDLRCETPPGATKQQCALVQRVAAEDVPGLNLIVMVLKLNEGKDRLMRIIAPLGVLLPKGLGLIIDENKIGTTGFARCNPHGCVAEAILDDKLLDQLKTGKSATFVVHETPDKGIGLPVALAGFKEGLAKLP
jgi:invasion protein IalB